MRFEAILEKRVIAPIQRADYKKWLRYFLDFCTKYPVPEARPDQVRLFIDKLREKKQTPVQQKQAAHAVSLYFEIQRKGETPVANSNTDRATSLIPKPQQVRERSLSFP
ncbi:MAG: phage integrase N-terminal SAM-like domain-containing protein, partial [Deltaproteobacteria bacterium]|nr:phage integrase N-terminal SAM-like domain-containing protein [Deltaproteobacteria bacterium]